MKPAAFLAQVQKGQVHPIYLFVGEAHLLIEQAWKQLLEKIVPSPARRFNGETFQAKDISMDEVRARLATVQMFGDRRLILVRNVEAWNKEQRAALQFYAERPIAESCLVLTASQKKGLAALEKAVNTTGAVVDFSAPRDNELPKWLQDRARLNHKQLAFEAAAALVDRVGDELFKLENELEKVCIFVGERERIDPVDVEQVVSQGRKFSVFELLRAVGQSQVGQAFAILRQLLLKGEPPLVILALLARQVRMIWQVKDSLQRGSTLQQIGQVLKLPLPVIRNYDANGKLFSEGDLFRVHRSIRAADVLLKSTAVSQEAVLESLIFELCRRNPK